MSDALVRSHDWSSTSLGPIERWPATLRGYVAMVMAMPTPAIIFWGPDQLQIYNTGYAVIMGPRHPRYFAAPYRECWPDTYPTIQPWMEDVLRGGVRHVEQQLFTLTRHGFTEEAYFTFSFSPLRDDSGAIAGVLQPVVETTDVVLATRRTETLRALGGDVAAAFAANPEDVPFSIIQLTNLQATSGLVAALDPAARARLDALVGEVRATRGPVLVEDVAALLGQPHVGTWGEPTRRAIAQPIVRDATGEPIGVIVLGISPRLAFDDRYRAFFDAIARELASRFEADRARHTERELLVREQAARREAELQKAHLSALFTQAPAVIVVLRGPDMVIELANPIACAVWGRDPATVVDRPLFEVLPELRGQVFERLLERVYREGTPAIGEATRARLHPPGNDAPHDVFLSFVYAPLRGVEGQVEGVLVFAFDVTEQVRAREQIETLRAAAEGANQAKDQFLAVLGHELRNPLAPILAGVEVLRQRGDLGLDRTLDVISRQATHMIRLVDDLLDLSRITRGQLELRLQPVELADLVADAVEMTRSLFAQRQHELVIEVPASGLAVDADRTRMTQVIGNLLANAAKYTEQRGRVTVRGEAGERGVVLRVQDTGIGIDAATLPRIFDMFVQAPQASDRARGGLGLGLSIVKSLVELHGGTVAAHSEGPHRGTELVIELPRADATTSKLTDVPSQDLLPPVAAPDDALRVLIVDDNEDAANLLAELLELHGSTIRVAHDGPSALRIASTFAPHVGLLDLGLPVMDGFELAGRLRADQPSVKLVAVTGYGQPGDRARSQAAGFDAHLVKPVDLDALRALLARFAPVTPA